MIRSAAIERRFSFITTSLIITMNQGCDHLFDLQLDFTVFGKVKGRERNLDITIHMLFSPTFVCVRRNHCKILSVSARVECKNLHHGEGSIRKAEFGGGGIKDRTFRFCLLINFMWHNEVA